MKMIFSLLSVISVILLYSVKDFTDAAVKCEEPKVKTCADLITSNTEDPSRVVPGNVVALNELCNTKLKAAQTCMATADCDVTDRLMKTKYNPYFDAVTYMCGEGRKAAEANVVCYNTPKTMIDIKACKATTTGGVDKDTPSPDQVCKMANDIVHCIHKEVLKDCSKDGAKVFSTVWVKTFQSLLVEAPSCQLKNPASGAAVISSQQSVLVLTSILIGAAYFL